MRITPGMTADNAVYNLQQGRQTLETLQEQISSGMNVSKPSDDPLTARQLLDLQNQITAGDQYSSNITKGTLLLNVAGTALDSMSSVMQQVKKLASDMANGTSDQASKTSAVSNLTQFRQQLLDLANTRVGDQYVFGGFSNSAPFDTAGNFSGTDDAVNVEIAPGSQLNTTVSGGKLLRGNGTVGSGASAGSSPTDIIGGISALITAIAGNNTAGIADGIKNMKAAADQINAASADVSGRLVRMDNMKNMIGTNQESLKTVYGNLQNVDMAKVGVLLSQQTTAFNAALSTTAKLTQLSLLDYMK